MEEVVDRRNSACQSFHLIRGEQRRDCSVFIFFYQTSDRTSRCSIFSLDDIDAEGEK